MVIAMAARNAVEDLHAGGAFTDRQAPALNRRLRNRVYAVTLALLRLDRDQPDAGLVALIEDQARIDDPTLDGSPGIEPDAAVAGAIRGAIREFARAEAITPGVTAELEQAAVSWGIAALHGLQHLERPKSGRQVSGLAWMVPSYWEMPAIEPKLRRYFAPSARSHTPDP